MSIKLSSFLQSKFNMYIYAKLGWKLTFFYIIFLGKLYFFLRQKEKQKIIGSVSTVFKGRKDKSEINAIRKRVFRGILSHYYEKLFNAYGDFHEVKDFLKKSIDAKHLYKLDNALARGKGVLFVTAHYGAIEYIPIFLALNRYPISVIMKFATEKLKSVSYYRSKVLGVNIIDANQKNKILGVIIRELKANRIVFIECDEIDEWRPSRKNRMLFLRKEIGIDRTISIIGKRTGAEIVFGIIHRFSLHKYRFIMENYQEILPLISKTNPQVEEALLSFLEHYIYSSPEQWYQWKNYMDMGVLQSPDMENQEFITLPLLEPALGRIL